MTMLDYFSKQNSMPRGELTEFILLCSFEDRTNNLVHGIGLRKSISGLIRINVVRGSSSFTEDEGGNGPLLVVSARVDQPRSFRVNPELHYVKVNPRELTRFREREDVKECCGSLLLVALAHTLHEFYGVCNVPIPGVSDLHPAFVFISSSGEYTALTLTSSVLKAPAVICVNHIQPALDERTFWRASCFQPLAVRPRIETWAREMDVAALKAIITSTVFTFNALNCDSSEDEVCDENGVYHGVLNGNPCPYDITIV